MRNGNLQTELVNPRLNNYLLFTENWERYQKLPNADKQKIARALSGLFLQQIDPDYQNKRPQTMAAKTFEWLKDNGDTILSTASLLLPFPLIKLAKIATIPLKQKLSVLLGVASIWYQNLKQTDSNPEKTKQNEERNFSNNYNDYIVQILHAAAVNSHLDKTVITEQLKDLGIRFDFSKEHLSRDNRVILTKLEKLIKTSGDSEKNIITAVKLAVTDATYKVFEMLNPKKSKDTITQENLHFFGKEIQGYALLVQNLGGLVGDTEVAPKLASVFGGIGGMISLYSEFNLGKIGLGVLTGNFANIVTEILPILSGLPSEHQQIMQEFQRVLHGLDQIRNENRQYYLSLAQSQKIIFDKLMDIYEDLKNQGKNIESFLKQLNDKLNNFEKNWMESRIEDLTEEFEDIRGTISTTTRSIKKLGLTEQLQDKYDDNINKLRRKLISRPYAIVYTACSASNDDESTCLQKASTLNTLISALDMLFIKNNFHIPPDLKGRTDTGKPVLLPNPLVMEEGVTALIQARIQLPEIHSHEYINYFDELIGEFNRFKEVIRLVTNMKEDRQFPFEHCRVRYVSASQQITKEIMNAAHKFMADKLNPEGSIKVKNYEKILLEGYPPVIIHRMEPFGKEQYRESYDFYKSNFAGTEKIRYKYYFKDYKYARNTRDDSYTARLYLTEKDYNPIVEGIRIGFIKKQEQNEWERLSFFADFGDFVDGYGKTFNLIFKTANLTVPPFYGRINSPSQTPIGNIFYICCNLLDSRKKISPYTEGMVDFRKTDLGKHLQHYKPPYVNFNNNTFVHYPKNYITHIHFISYLLQDYLQSLKEKDLMDEIDKHLKSESVRPIVTEFIDAATCLRTTTFINLWSSQNVDQDHFYMDHHDGFDRGLLYSYDDILKFVKHVANIKNYRKKETIKIDNHNFLESYKASGYNGFGSALKASLIKATNNTIVYLRKKTSKNQIKSIPPFEHLTQLLIQWRDFEKLELERDEIQSQFIESTRHKWGEEREEIFETVHSINPTGRKLLSISEDDTTSGVPTFYSKSKSPETIFPQQTSMAKARYESSWFSYGFYIISYLWKFSFKPIPSQTFSINNYSNSIEHSQMTNNSSQLLLLPLSSTFNQLRTFQPYQVRIQWDDVIEHHPETFEPIYTLKAFDSNNEIGSIRYYKQKGFCRSETGQRHNIYETKGIFSSTPIDPRTASQICVALPPPTLLDQISSEATRAAKHGVIRGVSKALAETLEKRNFSTHSVKVARNIIYYGTIFLMYLWDHYFETPIEQSVTARTASATYNAVWNTGMLAMTNIFIQTLCIASNCIGKKAKQQGMHGTGHFFETLGNYMGYGIYAIKTYQEGLLMSGTSIISGAIAEEIVVIGLRQRFFT